MAAAFFATCGNPWDSAVRRPQADLRRANGFNIGFFACRRAGTRLRPDEKGTTDGQAVHR